MDEYDETWQEYMTGQAPFPPPAIANTPVVVTQSTYAKCNHNKPFLVFKTPLRVWAGAAFHNCKPPKNALVVDLADSYSPVLIAEGFRLPTKYNVSYKRLNVNWPDFSTPDITKDMWYGLAKILAKESSDIFIACKGGHGRTGTALSILGRLWGAIPADVDPIERIRDIYCEEAVETWSQIYYVEDTLDIKSKETPPTTWKSTTTTTPLIGGVHDDNCSCDKCWIGNIAHAVGCNCLECYKKKFPGLASNKEPVIVNYVPTAQEQINRAPKTGQCNLRYFNDTVAGTICQRHHFCTKVEKHRANHECGNCAFQWKNWAIMTAEEVQKDVDDRLNKKMGD